jgi:hypothetical protein
MASGHRSIIARVALCALLTTATVPATAQVRGNIGLSTSDVVWIGVGVAAIGAGIGIGVFYAVRHGHSLNGCAVSGASGLELQNRGDQRTYALLGEVAGIKPGDRVRVSGKKEKKNPGSPQRFLVEKISRDYGACKVETAMR